MRDSLLLRGLIIYKHIVTCSCSCVGSRTKKLTCVTERFFHVYLRNTPNQVPLNSISVTFQHFYPVTALVWFILVAGNWYVFLKVVFVSINFCNLKLTYGSFRLVCKSVSSSGQRGVFSSSLTELPTQSSKSILHRFLKIKLIRTELLTPFNALMTHFTCVPGLTRRKLLTSHPRSACVWDRNKYELSPALVDAFYWFGFNQNPNNFEASTFLELFLIWRIPVTPEHIKSVKTQHRCIWFL